MIDGYSLFVNVVGISGTLALAFVIFRTVKLVLLEKQLTKKSKPKGMLCFLGKHKWAYHRDYPNYPVRECQRCEKYQIATPKNNH